MIGGKSAARAAGMDNTAAMPAIAKTRILNMTCPFPPGKATKRRPRVDEPTGQEMADIR
jgi:hypothetical protein